MSLSASTRPGPGHSFSPLKTDPPVDSAAVREQLERLLESHLFRNSKRYPALLRHVVETTLDGRASELKERLLGIAVFGRPADYDTNLDPVVRTSAAEIRKRIAQYYLEPAHENEMRIDLPLGSYVPEFRWPARAVPQTAPAASRTRRAAPLAAGACAVAAIAAAALWFHPWSRPSPFDEFWQPLLNPNSPVVLCVGLHQGGVGWPDALTLARLTGVIEAKRQPFDIRREDLATFTDLSHGPAILIGAFNDAWTLLLTQQSRFGFARDASADWITDSRNPSLRQWSVDSTQVDSAGHHVYHEDYAIVSRVLDPRTGRIVVTVAGLHGFGTAAAGEFITRPEYLAELAARAPADWQRKNIQVVLRTEVINGNSGPPRIVADYFW